MAEVATQLPTSGARLLLRVVLPNEAGSQVGSVGVELGWRHDSRLDDTFDHYSLLGRGVRDLPTTGLW